MSGELCITDWRYLYLTLRDKSYYLVLVSRQTGRIASGNSWQISLAALACIHRDHSGILSLLPTSSAVRLLKMNDLELRSKRGKGAKLVRVLAREQAQVLLPTLKSIYQKKLARHQPFRSGAFCSWITNQLSDHRSTASRLTNQHGFDELINAGYAKRWWQDQLHKLQSY